MTIKVIAWGMARILIFFISIALYIPGIVSAHCDTLAGPVVADAKKALEKSDVTPVLKWIKKEYEEEVKEAFQRTLTVRKKGKEARELADMYFFETLVRLHRTGEGAPYRGLKRAEEIEPIIVETDKALESGSVENLVKKISETMSAGVQKRFSHARDTKKHAEESVAAGRESVEAYVELTHYVERLYLNAEGNSAHTTPGKGQAEKHQHQ